MHLEVLKELKDWFSQPLLGFKEALMGAEMRSIPSASHQNVIIIDRFSLFNGFGYHDRVILRMVKNGRDPYFFHESGAAQSPVILLN